MTGHITIRRDSATFEVLDDQGAWKKWMYGVDNWLRQHKAGPHDVSVSCVPIEGQGAWRKSGDGLDLIVRVAWIDFWERPTEHGAHAICHHDASARRLYADWCDDENTVKYKSYELWLATMSATAGRLIGLAKQADAEVMESLQTECVA